MCFAGASPRILVAAHTANRLHVHPVKSATGTWNFELWRCVGCERREALLVIASRYDQQLYTYMSLSQSAEDMSGRQVYTGTQLGRPGTTRVYIPSRHPP